ncbi:hypothetical protein PILCRDRAFT_9052 [Piloderma croceum F 1598]|uniref:Uncharacterized protein n=1 Tax=Piloderma croceum (strain F 1598) TaxID=765440 RepID=A0A0C3FP52_PILCF|nr:hypothetical protein PILCRDRAFT_9052 [Piloderma croceum F 1598]
MGRKYKRMNKKAHQNQKLWAEGCRETILAPHIEPYADALARSAVCEHDYLCRVLNEYHQLIPWNLPDDEEPLLPLPAYDPRPMAPEEFLTDEEALRKSQMISRKNKAIQHWLKYRVCKLNKRLIPHMDPEKNPWMALLVKLSGTQRPPVKAHQPFQQFMHECYASAIKPLIDDKLYALRPQGNFAVKNDAAF